MADWKSIGRKYADSNKEEQTVTAVPATTPVQSKNEETQTDSDWKSIGRRYAGVNSIPSASSVKPTPGTSVGQTTVVESETKPAMGGKKSAYVLSVAEIDKLAPEAAKSVYDSIWTDDLQKEYEEVTRITSELFKKQNGYDDKSASKYVSSYLKDTPEYKENQKGYTPTEAEAKAVKRKAELDKIKQEANKAKAEAEYEYTRAKEVARYTDTFGADWISPDIDLEKADKKTVSKAVADIIFKNAYSNGGYGAETKLKNSEAYQRALKGQATVLDLKQAFNLADVDEIKQSGTFDDHLKRIIYMYSQGDKFKSPYGSTIYDAYHTDFLTPEASAISRANILSEYKDVMENGTGGEKFGKLAEGFLGQLLVTPQAYGEALAASAKYGEDWEKVNKDYGVVSSNLRGVNTGRSALGTQVATDILGGNEALGSFVYNTADSIANNVARMVYGPASGVMGFVQAGQSELDKSIQNLENPENAIIKSTISGAAEGIGELVQFKGLQNVLGKASLIKNPLKRVGTAVLYGGLNEVPSELSTDVINLVTDEIMSGENSEMRRALTDLVTSGKAKDYGTAFSMYLSQRGLETAFSAFVSGGLLAGVPSVFNYDRTTADGLTRLGKRIKAGEANLDILIEQAMASKNRDTVALAKKKNLSDMEIGMLYDSVRADVANGNLDLNGYASNKMFGAMGRKIADEGRLGELIAIAKTSKNGRVVNLAESIEEHISDGGKTGDGNIADLVEAVVGDLDINESTVNAVREKGTANAIEDVAKTAVDDALVDVSKANTVPEADVELADIVTKKEEKKPLAVKRAEADETIRVEVADKDTFSKQFGHKKGIKAVGEDALSGTDNEVGKIVVASDLENTVIDLAKASGNAEIRESAKKYENSVYSNANKLNEIGRIAKAVGITGTDAVQSLAASIGQKYMYAVRDAGTFDRFSSEIRAEFEGYGNEFGIQALDYLDAIYEKRGALGIQIAINAVTNTGYSLSNKNKVVENFATAMQYALKAMGNDVTINVVYDEKAPRGEWNKVGSKTTITINGTKIRGAESASWVLSHELFHEGSKNNPGLADRVIDVFRKMGLYDEKSFRYFAELYGPVFEKQYNDKLKSGAITQDEYDDMYYRYINEEIAADIMFRVIGSEELTTMFANEASYEDLNFIAKFFKKFFGGIKKVFTGTGKADKFAYEADTIVGQFERAIKNKDNTKRNNETDTRNSLSSIGYSFYGNENLTAKEAEKMLEDGSWKKSEGYKKYLNDCISVYEQAYGKASKNDIAQIEKSIEGIMRVAIAAKKAGYDIQDNGAKRNTRDSKNRLLFTSLEPNSDYITSSDISAICDKRKTFTEIYDDIVRIEEANNVPASERFFSDVNNYFLLHKIMASKGLVVPCEECYVESMRKNLAPMANAFITLVTETDSENKKNAQLYNQSGKKKGTLKENNAKIREKVIEICAKNGGSKEQIDKIRNLSADELAKFIDNVGSAENLGVSLDEITVEMLTTAEGLAQLKLRSPLLYEAFNSFYGQSKPKMPKEATPFRPGELIALFTDKNNKINTTLIEKVKSTGGFRLQSYSDFQIGNFVDVLQTIFEASMLGLNGHAYTKVPAFLDATEGTNLKRNLSIFMYEDGGKWMLDKKNSFPMELDDIYALVAKDKSGNTSIIAVSQNAKMSAWIMANDLVGYGIPFHKSGLKMDIVRLRDVKTPDGRTIKGYSNQIDHTKQQSEVYKYDKDGKKKNSKVSKPIDIYSFWDFENKEGLSKNELIEKNLKAYIDECEKAGYRPKFRDYVMNNDKVLNDVLAYSKELGFVSEDATIDDISFKHGEYRIPYGYYKFLGDFGMFTPEGEASPIKPLSLAEYDFDKAVGFFDDAKALREKELLQQFENGKVREEYRQLLKEGKMTLEQLQEVLDAKKNEAVQEVVAGAYKDKKYALQGKDKFGKEYAPTFYSQMSKTIDGMKDGKIGANSVVSYLKGKGVKNEEIKWSGIETFLEGKKSVTKAELQEFVAGNQLEIEEETRDKNTKKTLKDKYHIEGTSDTQKLYYNGKLVETFTKDEDGWWSSSNNDYFSRKKNGILDAYLDGKDAGLKWEQYTLDGGKNYRELLFKLPNSTYYNGQMRAHWGNDAQGILAHARIQDFKVDGKKMLFIEEIQSDLHNVGHTQGYIEKGQKMTQDVRNESADAFREFVNSDIINSIISRMQYEGHSKAVEVISELFEGNESAYRDVVETIGGLTSEEKAFIDNTIALEKQRKQQHESALPDRHYVPDAPFRDNYHEFVLKRLIREAAEKGYDSIGWTTADIQSKRWSDKFAEGYRIEYDQDIPKFLNKYGKKWGATVGSTVLKNGEEVWSMDIPDAMKESVLYEGQSRFALPGNNKLGTEYLELAKDPEKNKAKLDEMVAEVAKTAMPDSKVVDKDGKLKYVYHGTSNGGHTWFDTYAYYSKFGLFGNGAYFTEDRNIAEQYTRKGRGTKPQVYSVFLNITNPIDMDAIADIEAWNEAMQKASEDLSLLDGEMTNEQAFRRMVEDLEYAEVYSYDAAEIVRNVFENMGYNGITHIGGGRVGMSDGTRHRVWIAFESEQIKSADAVTYDDNGNVIPLSERFNPEKTDIRWALNNENAVFDESQQGKAVRSLKETAKDLGVSRAQTADFVSEVMDALGDTLQSGVVSDKTYEDVAKVVFKYAREDTGESDYARTIIELKQRLFKYGLFVSEHLKNDIPDYNDFRKKYGTLLRSSNEQKNKGVLTVDEIYTDLSIDNPGLFPKNLALGDQLTKIAEVIDKAREYEEKGVDKTLAEIYKDYGKIKGNLVDMASDIIDGIAEDAGVELVEEQAVYESLREADENIDATEYPEEFYITKGATDEEINEILAGIESTYPKSSDEYKFVKRLLKEEQNVKEAEKSVKNLKALIKAKSFEGDNKRINDFSVEIAKEFGFGKDTRKTADVARSIKGLCDSISAYLEDATDDNLNSVVANIGNAVEVISGHTEGEVDIDKLGGYLLSNYTSLGKNSKSKIEAKSIDDIAKRKKGTMDVLEKLQQTAETSMEQLENDLEEAKDDLHKATVKLRGQQGQPFFERVIDEVGRVIDEVRLADDMYYNRKISEQKLADDMYYGRKISEEKMRTESEKERLDKYKERIKEQAEKDKEARKRLKEKRSIRKKQEKLLESVQRLKKLKTDKATKELINEIVGNLDSVAISLTDDNRLRLEALRKRYEYSKQNNEDFIGDTDTEKRLERLDKTQISDLTVDELEHLVHLAMRLERDIAYDKSIRVREKAINTQRAAKSGIRAIWETKGVNFANPVKRIANRYMTALSSPKSFFKKAFNYEKNNPMYQVTVALNDAERANMMAQQGLEGMFDDLIADDRIETFTGKKATEYSTGITDDKGREIKITPEMKVALYLASQNRDFLRHAKVGGINFPNLKLLKKGKIADAYKDGSTVNLLPSEINKIVSDMTEYEMEWANVAKEFFNERSKELINKASLELYGYEIANVDNYFPIRTDPDTTGTEISSLVKNATIEGAGIFKERTGAVNGIILENLTGVLQRHIKQVSKFATLAVPIKNFNKAYKASINFAGAKTTVAKEIGRKYGAVGQKFIENYISDLQAPRKAERTFLDNLRNKRAASLMIANLPVTIGNLGNLLKAMPEVGAGAVVKNLVGKKVDVDLVSQYSPHLAARMEGYTNKELSDIARGNVFGRKKGVASRILNMMQFVDIYSTKVLWNASEYYVSKNFKNLEQGTDAYYNKVAEVFDNAVESSMVSDMVSQRADILKSSNPIYNELNMFKSELYKNLDIMRDAVGEYKATEKKYGGRKALFEAAKRGDAEAKEVVSHTYGVMASQVATGMFVAVVNALMKGLWFKKWAYKDEEEDDVTAQSLLNGTIEDFAMGFISMFPGAEEAVTGLGYLLGKESNWYGNNITAFEMIDDVVEGVKDIIDSVDKMQSGDVSWKTVAIETYDFLSKTVAPFFGIPAENLKNIVYGTILRTVEGVNGEHYGKYLSYKISEDGHFKYTMEDMLDVAFKAYSNGDTEAFNRIRSDMIDAEFISAKKFDEKFNNFKSKTVPLEESKDYQRVTEEYEKAEKKFNRNSSGVNGVTKAYWWQSQMFYEQAQGAIENDKRTDKSGYYKNLERIMSGYDGTLSRGLQLVAEAYDKTEDKRLIYNDKEEYIIVKQSEYKKYYLPLSYHDYVGMMDYMGKAEEYAALMAFGNSSDKASASKMKSGTMGNYITKGVGNAQRKSGEDDVQYYERLKSEIKSAIRAKYKEDYFEKVKK